MRVNAARNLLADAPYLVAALFLAGIVHIVSVLAMPRITGHGAFDVVAARHARDHVDQLAAPTPANTHTPFEDPAFATAVCRYDLSDGPLRVSGHVEGIEFLSISMHARYSGAFYAMSDSAAVKGEIAIELMTRAQRVAIEAQDNPDDPPVALRLTAPETEGFVYFRSFAAQPGDRPAARARIGSFSCGSDQPPEG
jgi:uncharacterized membrane protein